MTREQAIDLYVTLYGTRDWCKGLSSQTLDDIHEEMRAVVEAEDAHAAARALKASDYGVALPVFDPPEHLNDAMFLRRKWAEMQGASDDSAAD